MRNVCIALLTAVIVQLSSPDAAAAEDVEVQFRKAAAAARALTPRVTTALADIRLQALPITYRLGTAIDRSKAELAKRIDNIERWGKILDKQMSVTGVSIFVGEVELLLQTHELLDRQLLDAAAEVTENERLYNRTLEWGTKLSEVVTPLISASSELDRTSYEYYAVVDEAIAKCMSK